MKNKIEPVFYTLGHFQRNKEQESMLCITMDWATGG
jgi:hypothetical protein